MQQRHLLAEVGGETARIIWGVRAISGTRTIAVLPLVQQALDQPDIHLRLAAAGDALQQRDAGRLPVSGWRQNGPS